MSAHSKPIDIHQEITDRIVAAIDTAGEVQLPWIRNSGCNTRPVNVASRNPYNGVNVLSLWVAAMTLGYASNLWGTYRQWQDKGCQVRKGEKASLIVFYKTESYDSTDEATGETVSEERLIARASWVFNAAQVDGLALCEPDLPEAPIFDPIPAAEAFARATGAEIVETGDRACYIPSSDVIHMPERRRFDGTATSTPAEGFYSTLCHELVHWSGAKARLDRDLTGRFGKEAYAVEELVAELGAAFLCADLSITREPRPDHACYIKNWLAVPKNDKKAIFTAAAKASQAAQWLQKVATA